MVPRSATEPRERRGRQPCEGRPVTRFVARRLLALRAHAVGDRDAHVLPGAPRPRRAVPGRARHPAGGARGAGARSTGSTSRSAQQYLALPRQRGAARLRALVQVPRRARCATSSSRASASRPSWAAGRCWWRCSPASRSACSPRCGRTPPTDAAVMGVALAGVSIPNFVLGPLLVLVFALGLYWLPPALWEGPAEPRAAGAHAGRRLRRLRRAPDARRHARGAAPGLRPHRARQGPARARWSCSSTRCGWGCCRWSPTSGRPRRAIMMGSLVVEQVFAVPGLGRYLVQGAFNRDYTLVTGRGAVLRRVPDGAEPARGPGLRLARPARGSELSVSAPATLALAASAPAQPVVRRAPPPRPQPRGGGRRLVPRAARPGLLRRAVAARAGRPGGAGPGARRCAARRSRTGSAPTSWGATCWRACCTAGASRSWSGWWARW